MPDVKLFTGFHDRYDWCLDLKRFAINGVKIVSKMSELSY